MQSARAAYKEDAAMFALVVHSTHELHQLKKVLPRRRDSLVMDVKINIT